MSDFQKVDRENFVYLYFYGDHVGEVTLEDLYQEFKARLLRELQEEADEPKEWLE